MRIAVLNRERCKPSVCNYLCQRVCPRVKTGDETIVLDEETKKPLISETLCSGCGICVKKCPFSAIKIINVPEEAGDPVHQYGQNGFRLYNLPTPRKGVVGVVGANGVGKSTMMKILAGHVTPNLGGDAGWPEVIELYKGKEIQSYLEILSQGNVRAAYKPQYVESIPRHVSGNAGELLARGDQLGNLGEVISALDLKGALDKDVSSLSGGELQRFAIAACLTKDADIYLIDEPSSYLDVKERLNVAKAVQAIKDRYIFVVEHDLIVLDYLSDYIHLLYGSPGAYGVISGIKSVRVGINEYLDGFMKAENVRFRDTIRFEIRPPGKSKDKLDSFSYPLLEKKYSNFNLRVDAGEIYSPQVLGILGPNATGKTTFVKMLAGTVKPDSSELDLSRRISYKPQYIKPEAVLVRQLDIKPAIIQSLRLEHLMDKKVDTLSGGQLQKVAVAACLSKDADVYLLDEPSAYLDVEERLNLAKQLRSFTIENEASVLIVEHDILLIDYLSDALMVFSGEGGRFGEASPPKDLRSGMNHFLSEMQVTFRRDEKSGRPRANKAGSVKDRTQKSEGEYYYTGSR